MSALGDPSRVRALGTALLLFAAGALVGIVADRVVLRSARLEATPLTVEAMVDHLGLSASESERMRVLLDSLHAELAGVLLENPDSLRSRVHYIQQRIETALPEGARPSFREWILEHHQKMIGAAPHRALHGAP